MKRVMLVMLLRLSLVASESGESKKKRKPAKDDNRCEVNVSCEICNWLSSTGDFAEMRDQCGKVIWYNPHPRVWHYHCEDGR